MATEATRLEQVDDMVNNIKAEALAIADIASRSSSAEINAVHQHATAALQLEPQWVATRQDLVNAANFIVQTADAAHDLLFAPDAAGLPQFATRLGEIQGQTDSAASSLHKFNLQSTQVSASLNADGVALRARLQADQQSLTDVRGKIQQFNSDHELTAARWFEVFGKSLISLGIWPSIELDNARKEADRLNNELHGTSSEVQTLTELQGPMNDLQTAIQSLQSDLSSIAETADLASDSVGNLLKEDGTAPSPSSAFYRVELRNLVQSLERLRSLSAALIA